MFSNSDFVGDADVPATAVARGTPSFFGLHHRRQEPSERDQDQCANGGPYAYSCLSTIAQAGRLLSRWGSCARRGRCRGRRKVAMVVEEAMVDVVLVAVVVAVLPIVELEVAFLT